MSDLLLSSGAEVMILHWSHKSKVCIKTGFYASPNNSKKKDPILLDRGFSHDISENYQCTPFVSVPEIWFCVFGIMPALLKGEYRKR